MSTIPYSFSTSFTLPDQSTGEGAAHHIFRPPGSCSTSATLSVHHCFVAEDEDDDDRVLEYGFKISGNGSGAIKIAGGQLELLQGDSVLRCTPILKGPLARHFEDSYTEPHDGETYIIRIVLELVLPPPPLPEGLKRSARCFAELASTQLPHDVQFYFPFTDQELWAQSSVLTAASPYFKTLFESGFNESTPLQHQNTKLPVDQREKNRKFQDSDDKVDDSPKRTTRPKKDPKDTSAIAFRQIVVKEAAYTTYASVLCWIQSQYIEFAPLTSSFPSPETRLAKLVSSAEGDPLLPLPPSPKSVYRLAHYLEIEKLQEIALVSIKSQLSVENVAQELVGDVSRAYPEVQELELDFAFKNWKKVRESGAVAEIERRMEEGELPGAVGVAKVLLRLLKLATKLES